MTQIGAFERALGIPSLRRSGAVIAMAAVGYLVIAAAVAFYLLPKGLALSGAQLVIGQVVVLLAGAGMVAYIAVVIRRSVMARAALWATANRLGWNYLPEISDRLWGGSIDDQIPRKQRRSFEYLDARATSLPFDSALRTFTLGDGSGATMHTTRAVRVPLQAEAPRITLRSRKGGGALSALPRTPKGRNELRLEGDFSDVFEVSVPTGYERDALYLLTPDLMVILMDTASDLDLEIIDRTLHVYLEPEDLTRPEHLTRFVTVIAALHERFGRRTELYRDENAPAIAPDSVRRSGDTLSTAARRLPTRNRIGPILLAVLAPLVPLAIGVVVTNL